MKLKEKNFEILKGIDIENKLLGIEIPFSEISFVKKEIYVPFEFPLDTKHRAYQE